MKIERSSGQRQSGAVKAAGARRCAAFDLRAPHRSARRAAVAAAFGAIATLTAGGAFAQDTDPSHADGEPAPQAAPAAPAPAARPAPASYEAPPDDSGSGLGRTANNAVFIELLGNGGVYSLNYERIFDNFSVRAGFSYISIEAETTYKCGQSGCSEARGRVSLTTFPVVGNYFLGGANHKLQLGAGVLLASVSGRAESDFTASDASGFGVAGTAVVGYRYLPRKGGFNFGVGFTPLVGAGGFLPWGGISFGGVF